MSGFGPLNEKADHSHIFGNRDAEAFNDFTGARPGNSKAIAFDPKSAVETVHGFETLGLGTSTFLDGAPASKTAIQKTVQEAMLEERPRSSSEAGIGGGLARKKSLAQKIRSIRPDAASGRRRAPPPPGGNRSPTEGRSPTTPSDSKDDGAYINNNDYDDAYDRKGETITVEKRERAPSSPKKPHPGVSRIEESNNGGGLMKRVRSLSKPKRRNE